MKKRALSFLLIISILFTSLSVRLYTLALTPSEAVTSPSLRAKDIDISRGCIYDRNAEPLVNNAYTQTLVIKPDTSSLDYLKSIGESEDTISRVANGFLTILKKDGSPEAPKCQSIKTVKTTKRYKNNSLLHIIGYTDQNNNGVCGIEKYYNDYLNRCGGTLTVTYSADATGRVLNGENITIENRGYNNKKGIVLTIDKTIQEICETALKNSTIEKGGVIVMDSQSAEILGCASVPTYEREQIEKYITAPNSPFINRCFTPYPVGSVFKIVTAAAAIEGGTKLFDYYCNGYTTQSETKFNCNNTNGHGLIDFNTALSKSCNPYFIELGVKTGSKRLLNTAEALGFGKKIDFGNGFCSDAGVLPTLNELNSNASIGNFSFGQGKLTATPLQIASLFATIGNNGIYTQPRLISGFADENGGFLKDDVAPQKRVLKEETCTVIKNALEQTTVSGTGKSAFSSLYNCYGKTATAQSGQFDSNGKEIMYCWFCGILPYKNKQYVICVLKENGTAGGSDCGPVFKEIGENIIITERKQ